MSLEVNQDFQAELEAQQNGGKVTTLKAPQTPDEQAHAVPTIDKEDLFGEDALAGKIPELTQAFVIQKSQQDKAIELGQLAQEMYETKKVSRSQVIAMESIARELIPATEEEIAASERKVVVSDHEVNMYTEEPSTTEAASTITNCQANVDRIISDIRNSAIALGKQLVSTAQNDAVERNERVLKGVTLFNQAICKFVTETNSASLESSTVRFRRDLAWGNLMGMSLSAYSDADGKDFEKQISTFDGTSAETFVKSLKELIANGSIAYPVLSNFVTGEFCIVRDYEQLRKSDIKVSYFFTIGELFHTFGSSRFSAFYSYLSQETSTQIRAADAALKLLEGETSIEEIVMLSDNLQHQQQCLMHISSNMAVLSAVQYLIIEFLSTF